MAELRALREYTDGGIGTYVLQARDMTRVLRERTEDATTIEQLKEVVLLLIEQRGPEI